MTTADTPYGAVANGHSRGAGASGAPADLPRRFQVGPGVDVARLLVLGRYVDELQAVEQAVQRHAGGLGRGGEGGGEAGPAQHQRELVAAVGAQEHGAVRGAVGGGVVGGGRDGGEEAAHGRSTHVRHVDGEHGDAGRGAGRGGVRGVGQGVEAGADRGDGAAVPRLLDGPPHPPRGCVLLGRVAHDDHLAGVGHGLERPVEQGAPADVEVGLGRAAEPGAASTGEHQGHQPDRPLHLVHVPMVPPVPGWHAGVVSSPADPADSSERAPLRVALVQEASGLDPAENRARVPGLVPDGADLVVLPEAFARDFGPAGSDVSAAAEPTDGPFATAVADAAAARRTTVVAGMFEASDDPGRPWNTLVARGPDHGVHHDYRKVHLYDSFGYRESDRLLAGDVPRAEDPDGLALVDLGGWRLGLMTCYDLRFPELARRLVDAGAEVLVLPAAWVAGPRKVDHWRTLARARAIENTAYVVAAAQPGPRYSGHSMVVDPLGDVLAEAGEEPTLVRAELDVGVLVEARRTNPSLANRRL